MDRAIVECMTDKLQRAVTQKYTISYGTLQNHDFSVSVGSIFHLFVYISVVYDHTHFP